MEKEKFFNQALKDEIKWCKENSDKINMPRDWKDGFIAGLKQALLIAQKIKEGVNKDNKLTK